MKSKGTLVIALVLLTLCLAPAGASAQTEVPLGRPGGTNAVCSLSFTAHFSEGLGLDPKSPKFDSGGETGTIHCVGTILGQTVTGPGTFGFEGQLSNSSCLYHQAMGTAFLTLPTDAGPLRISGGNFTISGVGLVGVDHSTHDQPVMFDGIYVLLPTKGDCLTAPVTEAQVLMNGSVRGAEGAIRQCDLDLLVVKVNCRTRL